MAQHQTAEPGNRLNKAQMIHFLQNNSIYMILFFLVLYIIVREPSFLSIRVFGQILSQASSRIILALGVASIIVTGGTDLSAGRSIGMAAVITASLLQAVGSPQRIFKGMPELPIFLPILLAIALCVLFSFVHGIFVAKFKVAPFIASLAIQLVIYGSMSVYFDAINNGSPIGSLDPVFKSFAQGALDLGFMRIPYLIIYATICTLFVWFVWNKTKLGQNMYAIGGNIEAATVCGVNVARNTLLIYVLAGVLYGLAGSLEVARTGSATNSLGSEYALDAIAACVVGGVSMRGGIGKVQGVVIGVILFQVVNYGLIYIAVSAYVQYIVRGLIILLAVTIDTQKFVKKR